MHKIVIAVDNFEVETECGFSEDISMDGCGILGQNGFLIILKSISIGQPKSFS